MSETLLQKLTPSQKVQHHVLKAVLYFALVICVGMFGRQLNDQAKRNDANVNYKTLLNSGDIRPLENVQISYFLCPNKMEQEDNFKYDLRKCETDKTAKPAKQAQFLANINEVPNIKDSKGQSVKANWLRVILQQIIVLILPAERRRCT